jgi:hypothetical protein
VQVPEAVVHESKEACRNDDRKQVNYLLGICHVVLSSVVRNGNRVLCEQAKEKEYADGDEDGEKMATAISNCTGDYHRRAGWHASPGSTLLA